MLKRTDEKEWTLYNHDYTEVLGKFKSRSEALDYNERLQCLRIRRLKQIEQLHASWDVPWPIWSVA